ncbi:trans-sulfuration enzyme family protein [Haloferula chungangensis]|uniref:Trans-sulfuration enzyme family protein n=1 Tax=Haloferula chungangensis TaxID=1048331 RepID=A0ABW2LB05_9BACT
MKHPLRSLATRCAHAGSSDAPASENPPFHQAIAQSSLFRLGTSADAEAIFSGERPGHAYSRFGNPTVDQLANTLADLEGGSGALITSSGNAAILCAVTAAMAGRSGPLVTHPGIYGGSFELLKLLSEVYQLQVQSVDPGNSEQWNQSLTSAAAVLLETPSNPLMGLIDIAETVTRAQAGGASVIVDNTVATPYNQQPFKWGADWIIHSTSKFLNGHSDLIGGCVIKREPLTARDRAIHKNLGGTVNAMEAWLAHRGIRTFALRMQQHNLNGQAVFEWLQQRPEVATVHYPGFRDAHQIQIRDKQMTHPGALLSFELKGGLEAASRFLDRLKLIVHAVSLGGMESLATRPAGSSHRGMTPDARQVAGIPDGLIRLSVGTEDISDILEDLAQALETSP